VILSGQRLKNRLLHDMIAETSLVVMLDSLTFPCRIRR
jgi:hypothetical protein